MTLQLDSLDLQALREKRGTKWSHYGADVLPTWVADMDYPLAEPIARCLHEAVAAGDISYPPFAGPLARELPELFAARMAQKFQWSIAASDVMPVIDVMQGLSMALHTLLPRGSGVIVQSPVYPFFYTAVEQAGHQVMDNPLRLTPTGFTIDFDHLDRLLASANKPKCLLLCNPQNPTGRVFSREELTLLAARALRHNLLVISDEIHADLVYVPHRHIPMASLSPEIAQRTLTLTSASKAFNLAGLKCALAIFGNTTQRQKIESLPAHLRSGPSALGVLASIAAFREGDPWLASVLHYLDGNRQWLQENLSTLLPGGQMPAVQGTYLAWVDCQALELQPNPHEFFLTRAKVATAEGSAFGKQGKQHVRINFATSRAILAQILQRMHAAVAARH